jgi:hypothetical protein
MKNKRVKEVREMKRIIIFILLIMICFSLTTQAEAECNENEYKISFIFQANDAFCIIDLKDPLGESSHLEKLGIAPIIINGELFLPIKDFAKMMGGIICWDSEKEKIQMSFQENAIKFEFWFDKNSDTILRNGEIMLSLKFIIENLLPSGVKQNEKLKIVILTWPLAIN